MAPTEQRAPSRMDREQAVALLVAAATSVLAEKGATELKVRSVAEAAGVTPIAVYHHLGGLRELITAVIDKGFHDLGDAFAAAPASEDPVASLFSMALAARRFAKANPHLYDMMFGLSTRGSYRPLSVADRDPANNFGNVYTSLVEASRRLLRSGRIRPDGDPESLATQLWSAVHGYIALELSDHLARFDDPVRQVLEPMMANITVGLGDEARLANESHAVALAAAEHLEPPQ